MGNYNILDSETTLKILYKIRILGHKKSSVAVTINLHRNTIGCVCKSYEDFSDEDIKELYERNTKHEISLEELDTIFCKHRKEKLSATDKKEIEECCKKHLNCYLSKEDFARNLCKRRGIPFELIKYYNPEQITIDDYPNKAGVIADIHEIRNYRHTKKNYQEVYDEYYTETEQYAKNPISYSTFYNYARKLWCENEWKCNLGEYIDAKK